jgi:hypothetical protein
MSSEPRTLIAKLADRSAFCERQMASAPSVLFGLLPQPTGETDAAVAAKKPFIEVISAADFAACYRLGESDPDCGLMRYLLDPERIEDFFKVCATSEDREAHRKIIPMLQTSNVALFATFACDVQLTRKAFDLLDAAAADPQKAYGAGTLGRMFMRALDRWIDDIGEVLRYSDAGCPPLFQRVIAHLDNGVVFQILCNITGEDRPQAAEMIWHICRALFKSQFPGITLHKPRRVYFAKDFDTPTLEGVARANGFYVVKQFFVNLESEKRQFRDFNGSLLGALALPAADVVPPDFLDFAIALGPHAGLLTKLVDSLESGTHEHRDLICRYVAACATQATGQQMIAVVKAIFDAELRQADVTAVLALVRGAPHHLDFVAELRKLIVAKWSNDPLLLALCLEAQTQTNDFNKKPIVPEKNIRDSWTGQGSFEDAESLRPLNLTL